MHTWNKEFAIDVAASPERIWALFADVQRWPQWNPGVAHVALHGPFASGTTFEMAPPGEVPFTSTLVEVETNRRFVDETRLGEIVVRVAHVIEPQGASTSRVVYSIAVTGPDAPQIGGAISADFPDVLARLAEAAR